MRGQGKARAAMMEELGKRAGTPVTEARPGADTSPPPPGRDAVPAPAAKVAPSTDAKPDATAAPAAAAKPAEIEPQPEIGKDGKKTSPWRLVDQYKAKVSALEKEIADAKTGALPEQERNSYLERIQKTEAKLKEYEDEIRHVSYEKSPEFAEKYDKPYKAQWELAMSDLSEIPVTLQDGSTRSMKPEDLLTLVGMPLSQAQQVAQQAFGDFAGEVMQHRREIRKLSDARTKALEEAKTTGAQRDKERSEMMGKQMKEVHDFISKTWEQANNEAATHKDYGQFVSPRENDDEWNSRLEKGFKLTDSALTLDPRHPKLTPDQRRELIRKHAAIRHRSAAFGALTYEVKKLQAETTRLQGELDKFKGSTPPAAGGSSTASPAAPLRGMDAMKEALQKFAK